MLAAILNGSGLWVYSRLLPILYKLLRLHTTKWDERMIIEQPGTVLRSAWYFCNNRKTAIQCNLGWPVSCLRLHPYFRSGIQHAFMKTCQVTWCHNQKDHNVHLIKNSFPPPPYSQQANVQSLVPLSANGMAMPRLGWQPERFHNNAVVFRDMWMVLTLGYYIHVQYSSKLFL